MKIRIGFVSNSSSTSFCLFGIQIDSCDNFIKKLKPELKEKLKKELKITDDNLSDISMSDFVDFLYNNCKLDVFNDYNSYLIYIGTQWKCIKDDETGLQFKTYVKNEINSMFDNVEEHEFNTYDECWYN